jgi:carbon monoxide dehydrogenase subunit G
MKLQNSFEIPLPPGEAWDLLLDIERIAPCLPGATITEVIDDKTYKGQVAVSLGPVALSFKGTAAFEEIDEAGHRARAKAQGMDSKGRGGANALVSFRLDAAEAGSRVVIDTDLNLSGSIAQYGRGAGIIQATSEQLIGEFADNLRALLSERDATNGAEAAAPPPAKPISGLRLMLRVMWNAIGGLFTGRRA